MSAPVAVKPLVWEEILQQRSEADPTTEIVGYEASTGFCTYYTIELCAGSVSVTGLDYECTFHDTEDEAKAAAQANFEARILACLVSPCPLTASHATFSDPKNRSVNP